MGTAGAEQDGSIWPGDWSQFFPDLASGLIIGLLVGFALYLYTGWRAKTQGRERAKTGWEPMRSRLRFALRAEDPFAGAMSFFPSSNLITGIRSEFERYPVHTWAELLPRDAVLALIVALHDESWTYQAAAAEADGVIGTEVGARTWHNATQHGATIVIYSKLLGVPDELRDARIESLGAPITESHDIADAVLELPSVQKATASIMPQVTAHRRAYRALRIAYNNPR